MLQVKYEPYSGVFTSPPLKVFIQHCTGETFGKPLHILWLFVWLWGPGILSGNLKDNIQYDSYLCYNSSYFYSPKEFFED